MKANVEVVFKAELVDLSEESADAIRTAVQLVAGLSAGDREKFGITKDQQVQAKLILPELNKFRESNWRE